MSIYFSLQAEWVICLQLRHAGRYKLIKMCSLKCYLQRLWHSLFPQNKRKIIWSVLFPNNKAIKPWLMCLWTWELSLWPRIKHCVLWKFRQSPCQHTSIRASFFFFFDQNLSRSKSIYAERSYVPRKRNTNKEKEGQQLTLKSFSNTLPGLFTCSMPHTNKLIHSLLCCSHFLVLIKVCQNSYLGYL